MEIYIVRTPDGVVEFNIEGHGEWDWRIHDRMDHGTWFDKMENASDAIRNYGLEVPVMSVSKVDVVYKFLSDRGMNTRSMRAK